MEQAPTGLRDLLGYRFVEWTQGLAVVELEVGRRHLNKAGILHGGVLATVIDSACGACGLYCPYPDRVRRAVTLSLTTSFTGQNRGGLIRAVGRQRTAGRRIYTASAEVFGPGGELLAQGLGTFRYSRGSETETGVPRNRDASDGAGRD